MHGKNNIPNVISISRLILVPVIIILAYPGLGQDIILNNGIYTTSLRLIIAGILFFIGCLSDWLDGFIARKFNLTSEAGKLLDAVADKIFTNAVLILLIGMKVVPLFIGIILISRDFYMDMLRLALLRKNIVLAADWSGKATTLLKMFSIFMLFFIAGANFSTAKNKELIQQITLIPIYATTFCSLLSATNYSYKMFKVFKKSKKV